MNVLDESASLKGKKWKHYLWTIDKSAIPDTVKYAEEIGLIVREMKELKVFNSEWKEIFKYLLEDT